MSIAQLLYGLALAGAGFTAYLAGYARAINDERDRLKRQEWRARMAKAH